GETLCLPLGACLRALGSSAVHSMLLHPFLPSQCSARLRPRVGACAGMGQSSYIYILWVVILAAGLWIIISFGSLLHAREDLAGEWELSPERPASPDKPSSMHVDQS